MLNIKEHRSCFSIRKWIHFLVCYCWMNKMQDYYICAVMGHSGSIMLLLWAVTHNLCCIEKTLQKVSYRKYWYWAQSYRIQHGSTSCFEGMEWSWVSWRETCGMCVPVTNLKKPQLSSATLIEWNVNCWIA